MTVLQVLLIAVFGLLGTAKVARVPYMVDAAAHLGFSSRQYQLIGTAELLAVAGLLVGFWWPPAAVASGTDLVLQMLGALLFHVRNALAAGFVLQQLT